MADMPEADRRAQETLQAAWESIQAKMFGHLYEVPDAIMYVTTGWASGDTTATAADWLSSRPIVRVNLGKHADGKALLVELLHLAAHGVSTKREVEERQRRAVVGRDIAIRIAAGQSVSKISGDLRVSEGTVYRHRAAINGGRVVGEDEEVRQTGATGGTYHSQYFRDAAEALGLRVSKTRIPGRGFEIDADSPLASGSVTRYRAEIADLGKIIPRGAAKTKPGPVYLSCKCRDLGLEPRQIRMANGPGHRADKNEDVVCEICGAPFRLIEGSLTKPGFQGAGPGRGIKKTKSFAR